MFQNILYMEYLSDSMWPVKSSTSLTSILSTPSLNIITASLQEWKNIPIIAVGWEPTTILEMVHGVSSLWFQLMKMVCGRFAWFVCFWEKKTIHTKKPMNRNSSVNGLRKQPTFGDAITQFPHQMTSEKRAQKFHTDDVSLHRNF